ncbi:hypothetical protein XENORESO_015942 [Xenotaenia resolanae]|uniref:Uncharacterized protein n=1 Tax=Xenotaenia resolanae TaxID=208358 RepID=A0ABV0VTC4_9TELE
MDRSRQQRTIRSTERIIRDDLPFIQDLCRSRVRKMAAKISADLTHPACDIGPEGKSCLQKPAATQTVSSPGCFSDSLSTRTTPYILILILKIPGKTFEMHCTYINFLKYLGK